MIARIAYFFQPCVYQKTTGYRKPVGMLGDCYRGVVMACVAAGGASVLSWKFAVSTERNRD